MNLLHMNLGILDGVFSWMLNLVNEVIGALFILIINLFNLVFGAAMFMIASILGALTDFFQGVFKSLAGVGTYWQGRNPMPNGSDPVFAMITSDVIWKTFLIMLAIAFVLVILMSIVAIIRNEYNTDKANNTKGGVLGAAVKSIAFFAITPVVTVFGILGCNMLLRVLDTATGGQDTSVSGQVFAASAYGANYMRIEDQFAQFDGLGTIAQGLVEGMNRLFALTNYGDADTAKNSFYHLNNTLYDPSWYGQEGGKEKIAASVDAAFAEGMVIKETEAFKGLQAAAVANGLTSVILGGQTSLISGLVSGIGSANLTRLQWTNAPVVAMYYRLSDINYIVLIGGMVMALYVMYTAAFGLIMRLYKCTMLFMVSPPIIALGPMDNMSAFGNWRKQFVGQALSAYGVVIGMNLAFKLIAVTNNLNLFDPSNAAGMAGNMLVHALMSITALFMMKDFIKMISGFVGGEEASSAGADIAKKVTKTGLAVGAVALTGGVAAAGGALGGLGGAAGKGLVSAGKTLGSRVANSKVGQGVGNLIKGKKVFDKDADGNALETFHREGGLLNNKAAKGFRKFSSGSLGVADKDGVDEAGRKKTLFGIASTGVGALKGAMDNVGLGQFTKWLGGNVGKKFGTMKNDQDSEYGKRVILEKSRKEQSDFLKSYSKIESNDDIDKAMTDFKRMSTLKAQYDSIEDKYEKSEFLKEHKAETGSSEAALDRKYLNSRNTLLETATADANYTNGVNEVMKATFNITDADIRNMSAQERAEKLSQMSTRAELNANQYVQSIGSSLESDGKGGLKKPDVDAMASAFKRAMGDSKSKLDEGSIDALARGIAAAISGEADKMSEKIRSGLTGDDLQSATMKQLLEEMKGMRKDINGLKKD